MLLFLLCTLEIPSFWSIYKVFPGNIEESFVPATDKGTLVLFVPGLKYFLLFILKFPGSVKFGSVLMVL